MVLMLGLALVLASTKDCSDRLLTGSVVHGMGLQIAELVDQGLTGCPGEERANDVYVDDIRKVVASF